MREHDHQHRSAYAAAARPGRDQRGATLIEVMIGMVLVGILLIGMNSLWVFVMGEVDADTVRQQAIFRINGEMERLNAGFSNQTVAPTLIAGRTGTATVTNYASALPARIGSFLMNTVTGTRLIYADAGGALPAAAFTTDAATFTADIDGADPDGAENINDVYRLIYRYDNGTSGLDGDDRNIVWLDKDRSIVAQISWELLTVNSAANTASACYPSGATTPCRLLTLYLDYPFRYTDADPLVDMGPVETITLQTIVGARP